MAHRMSAAQMKLWDEVAEGTLLRARRLFLEIAQPGGVDLDPRAHGGRQGDAPDVAALGRRGLGPLQLVEDGSEVLEQRGAVEAHLADRGVDVAVPVGAVLDPPALDLA